MELVLPLKRLVPHHCFGTLLVILSLTLPSLASMALGPTGARAQTSAGLASMFAPVLHFTSGERFYPTSVDYLIGSSVLKERLANGSSVLITPTPSNSTLGNYNSSTYLESKLGTLDAIAADYSNKANGLGYFSYLHVVNSTSQIVIQYWLFYAYNNGPLNNHQGDLEVVEVFLDGSANPQRAVYSQHGAGENAAWSDVEKAGTHPVVYVAQGSHANYFRPYQGKIGIENDIVGSNGRTLMPTDLTLVVLGEEGNHPPNQGWLDYPGRWGYVGTLEQVSLGEAGPPGPVFNQNGVRWSQPQSYLNSTLAVNSNYFILAFLAAYFLIIFAAYLAIRGAAGSPVSGTSTQAFPVVGSTTVNWGFGLGAYLFLAAAVVRIIGGFIIRTTPELGNNRHPSQAAAVPAPP